VLGVAVLLAGPAMAQDTARSLTTSITQAKPLASPMGAALGERDGRIQDQAGGYRGSQVIGANVYNDDNQAIGTIDDLLVHPGGKVADAVVSVGGFLGIGSKLVKVPYDRLRFEQAKGGAGIGNGTTANAAGATGSAGTVMHVVLPGTTKEALNAMPTFNYAS